MKCCGLCRKIGKRRGHFRVGVLISNSCGGGDSGMKHSPSVSSACNSSEELSELEVTGHVIRMFREQSFKVGDGSVVVAMICAFHSQPVLGEGVAGMRGQELLQLLPPRLCGLGHEVRTIIICASAIPAN